MSMFSGTPCIKTIRKVKHLSHQNDTPPPTSLSLSLSLSPSLFLSKSSLQSSFYPPTFSKVLKIVDLYRKVNNKILLYPWYISCIRWRDWIRSKIIKKHNGLLFFHFHFKFYLLNPPHPFWTMSCAHSEALGVSAENSELNRICAEQPLYNGNLNIIIYFLNELQIDTS